ncbi:MAG TPA: hypothetical protein VLT33_06220 [Labilithrix sp.]|nr:hypothetical protein [Labilithrix sp.]
MTPELKRLRQQQEILASVFDQLELELVEDPSWDEPSDTSYLSAAERANPDIASNVAAMAETNKLVSWFGKDMEGFVGLWRGPDDRPVAAAPVVRLDTEGQYGIVAATIGDYLAISVDADDFAATRAALIRAGFEVGASADAIWSALDAFDDPNDYRNELYEEHRERRGLRRSDAAEPTASKTKAAQPAGPAKKKAAPAKKKAAPAKKKAAPAKKKAAPAKKKAAPAKKKAAPAKKKAAPAKKKPAKKK